MKNNKGFAPIAIILIIIALLAVGGIAYYAGKSSSPVPQYVSENNYQSQVDQNTSPTKSISILSPISEQQLIQGSPQVIKWSAPSGITKVDISASPIPDCKEAPCGSNTNETIATGIPSTGILNWVVPTDWIGKWTISIGDYNMRVSGVNVGSVEINVVAKSDNFSAQFPDIQSDYYSIQDWKLTTESKPFSCIENLFGAGETVFKEVRNNNTYCTYNSNKGVVAGTNYMGYKYSSEKYGKLMTVSLTLAETNCGVYNEPREPKAITCSNEQIKIANNIDSIIVQVFATIK